MPKKQTFTVWVQDENGTGTTHISSHEAENAEMASFAALIETADDWGYNKSRALEALRIVGVALGDVEIIEWND